MTVRLCWPTDAADQQQALSQIPGNSTWSYFWLAGLGIDIRRTPLNIWVVSAFTTIHIDDKGQQRLVLYGSQDLPTLKMSLSHAHATLNLPGSASWHCTAYANDPNFTAAWQRSVGKFSPWLPPEWAMNGL